MREATFFLNVIIHSLTYNLSMLHCFRPGTVNSLLNNVLPAATATNFSEFEIIQRIEKEVFASPSEVSMDRKDSNPTPCRHPLLTRIAFPDIFFGVEGHEDLFGGVVLNQPEEFIGIELACSGEFLGKSPTLIQKDTPLPRRTYSGALQRTSRFPKRIVLDRAGIPLRKRQHCV